MWINKVSLETKEISSKEIYTIISDVGNWSKWDEEIEYTKIEGNVEIGKIWYLKSKGGPKIKMEILDYKSDTYFIDLAYFPGAKMQTSHYFESKNGITKITFEIKIYGILGFLWKNIIGKEQINGFEKQIKNIINYSKNIGTQNIG